MTSPPYIPQAKAEPSPNFPGRFLRPPVHLRGLGHISHDFTYPYMPQAKAELTQKFQDGFLRPPTVLRVLGTPTSNESGGMSPKGHPLEIAPGNFAGAGAPFKGPDLSRNSTPGPVDQVMNFNGLMSLGIPTEMSFTGLRSLGTPAEMSFTGLRSLGTPTESVQTHRTAERCDSPVGRAHMSQACVAASAAHNGPLSSSAEVAPVGTNTERTDDQHTNERSGNVAIHLHIPQFRTINVKLTDHRNAPATQFTDDDDESTR